MLTRREKLLIRPWQLRRYNNHRKKVLTALPAIDFGPPPERHHVTRKLKKLQWEGERKTKIEEDNFRLLQRMGDIMKKNRLDNHWEKEPPNFLQRVGIYYRTRTPSPLEETTPASFPDLPHTRKSRCAACSHYTPNPPKIPEERIPWEPPKPRVSRRVSSSPSIPLSSDFDFSRSQSKQFYRERGEKDFITRSHPVSASSKYTRGKSSSSIDSHDRTTDSRRSRMTNLPNLSSKKRSKSVGPNGATAERLVLTQGALQLTVNLPPYAEVKVLKGKQEKYIQRSECECKSLRLESVS